jgi:hypothetical protein
MIRKEKTEKIPLQLTFLEKIQNIIPAHNSMVNELIDLLDISMDSAYRRLRGETSLTIEEVVILCNHYKISFDSFINLESGNVTFNYTTMDHGIGSFNEYLISLKRDMEIIHLAKDHQIIYACEDVPIFHNINFPAISAFKMFYWMKSIMNAPGLDGALFDVSAIPQEFGKLAQEIYALYCTIPSVEIWTDTTIQSTVKQIAFYWESGMFKTQEDALAVCQSLKDEIATVQKQAELGTKYLKPDMKPEYENNYSLYFSDIEITNNTVLVKLGDTKAVYLGHQTFNTMSTSNRAYCKETDEWMDNLISKSTLISGVSVKHRYQFFRQANKHIDNVIARIERD